MSVSLPLDAEGLIPHRLPMRLVDRLLEVGDDHCVAEAAPRPGHLLADGEGRLPAEALLEMMAQSFAALRGFHDRSAGAPVRMGYLVAVRGFRAPGIALEGDRLEIRVKETGSVDAYHMADAAVLRDGELLAEGAIRVWTPDPDEV